MRMSAWCQAAIPRETGPWTGLSISDLVGLVLVLVVAFGVVLGALALVMGWELFSDRIPRKRRRGVVVPRVGVIVRDDEGAR